MGGNNTLRSRIYQEYLAGTTKAEAAVKLHLNYRAVENYYIEFGLMSDSTKELADIKRVEMELFNLLETDPGNEKIEKLTKIYLKFNL